MYLFATLFSAAMLAGVAPQEQAGGTPGVAVVSLDPARRTVEVNLTAAPARLPLVPGTLTDVFAYNGTVPGPVLEFREGDHVVVHFRNDLPVTTTVHWHGFHLPFEADGSPFHPVAPGGETREAPVFDRLPADIQRVPRFEAVVAHDVLSPVRGAFCDPRTRYRG